MLPYWLLFLTPALAAIVEAAPPSTRQAGRHASVAQLQWLVVWVAIALVIGLRDKVGGDWFNYEGMLEQSEGTTFWEALTSTDPGFALLNWLTLQMDWGMVGVNMMTAPLFSLGLVRFCRSLPRPWLALAISIPYLVIVVAMGYSRQGVALGCGMLGLVALQRQSVVAFVFWVLLGATFHRTAVLLLPIAALVHNRKPLLTVVYGLIVVVGAYFVAVSEAATDLYENYVLSEYQSEGAAIRLAMNAVAAVLLLWKSRDFAWTPSQASLWRWFAWISLLLLAALAMTTASTAVDRVGLYMLPLQLVVFSHLPEVLGGRARKKHVWVAVVIMYYALVLFTWLNFATHSHYWLPYRFYPLELVE
jgi:hypothetical protein